MKVVRWDISRTRYPAAAPGMLGTGVLLSAVAPVSCGTGVLFCGVVCYWFADAGGLQHVPLPEPAVFLSKRPINSSHAGGGMSAASRLHAATAAGAAECECAECGE